MDLTDIFQNEAFSKIVKEFDKDLVGIYCQLKDCSREDYFKSLFLEKDGQLKQSLNDYTVLNNIKLQQDDLFNQQNIQIENFTNQYNKDLNTINQLESKIKQLENVILNQQQTIDTYKSHPKQIEPIKRPNGGIGTNVANASAKRQRQVGNTQTSSKDFNFVPSETSFDNKSDTSVNFVLSDDDNK